MDVQKTTDAARRARRERSQRGPAGAARCLALCVALGAALLTFVSAAAAMTVNTTADSVTPNDGSCSLREAILAVNAGSNSADCGSVVSGGTTPIMLGAGHYMLTGGELQVTAGANLAIIGADSSAPGQTVIDAAGASRVLEIAVGAQATLTAVEVTGGATTNGADGTSANRYGGPGANGAGLLNHGALILDHVLVTLNVTGHGGVGADGAASTTIARNPGNGGSGGSGGGVYNDANATLTVSASTISANGTGGGGAGGGGARGVPGVPNNPSGADGGKGGTSGSGGGIFNAGRATISTTGVSANFTGRGGAGGHGGDGAAASQTSGAGRGGDGGGGGNAGLEYDSNGNPAYGFYGGGGGIDNEGSLVLSTSTLSGNTTGAGGLGGGAGNGGQISNNSYNDGGHGGAGGSAGLGAGLLSRGTGAGLTNVTIAGNRTGDGGIGGNGAQSGSLGGGAGGFGGYGGGIWSDGASSTDSVQLTHVTVALNELGSAGLGGPDPQFPGIAGGRGEGAAIATGPAYAVSGGGVTETNTLIDANGQPTAGDENCEQRILGDIHDGGHDLSYPDVSCPGINGDPTLGALQSNGGLTQTMLPAGGSAAIEAIALGSCTVTDDQRGYPRPGQGKSACDIGSVETGPAPAASSTATTTSLSSSTNPSTAGAQVSLMAMVTPAPDGGTVSFTDGGTVIAGCAAVAVSSGGLAVCAPTYTVAGAHPIVADYLGDSSFTASGSSTLVQVVAAAAVGNASSGGGAGGSNSGGAAGNTSGVVPTSGGGSSSTGTSGGGSAPGGGGGTVTTGSGPGAGGGGSTAGNSGRTAAGRLTIGAISVHGVTAAVLLKCNGPVGAICVPTLTLSIVETLSGAMVVAVGARHRARARKRQVTVVLGLAATSLPGGMTRTVLLSLNPAGQSLLSKYQKLKVSLIVGESQSGRTTVVLRRRLRFSQ